MVEKYEVLIRETSYYWYLVEALNESDAKENWPEGTLVTVDWDESEFDAIEVKKVDDV